MIEPKRLVQLLGKSITDPEVERLQKELGDSEVMEMDPTIYFCFYGQGLCLVFTDKVLTAIHLFPEGRDGYRGYPYPIPHNLRFGLEQKDVRAALGNPTRARPDSDTYRFQDHALSVEYDKQQRAVSLLTFMTPETFAALS
jgi:hypothetical protein